MITVPTYNSILYRRNEVWFNDDPTPNCSADNTIFYQSSVIPLDPNIYVTEFKSSIIDLNRPLDDILARVNSTFRNHIRRADKCGIRFARCDSSSEAVIHFLESQREWGKTKERTTISQSRLNAILKHGSGRIFAAMLDDSPLVYHLYVSDGQRARMVTSHTVPSDASAKTVGYANKKLHFEAIKNFKENSFSKYDFGGVDDIKTPGIAKFKKSFGGNEEVSYNFSLTKGVYSLVQKLQTLRQKS